MPPRPMTPGRRAAAKSPQPGWALLTSPLVLFLLLFLGFPTVVDVVYSLSRVSFETLRTPRLSGLGNYGAALGDPGFWSAMWFSLRFGVVTALAQCLVGLALAVFLADLIGKRQMLLAPLMLPMMVAPALVGLMYRLVLNEFAGPVPYYLDLWFGNSPAFLGPGTVFWTLTVVQSLQWTPFAFLLFYAAFMAIPGEMREAAAIDGATRWQTLCRVELPLMAPTIGVAAFIRFIDGFSVFDNVFMLVGPGPGGSTTSISIYIYEAFFKEGTIGKAIAASIVLFAASFLVLLGIGRLASQRTAA